MLTSLRLKDWKSFGNGPAMPFAPLTLLVGPNGSGKSNLLDALRFLQGAALDLPLRDVWRGRYEGQREIWPGIRGHIAEAARSGAKSFEIATRWQRNTITEGHAITIALGRDVTVSQEVLSSEKGNLSSFVHVLVPLLMVKDSSTNLSGDAPAARQPCARGRPREQRVNRRRLSE